MDRKGIVCPKISLTSSRFPSQTSPEATSLIHFLCSPPVILNLYTRRRFILKPPPSLSPPIHLEITSTLSPLPPIYHETTTIVILRRGGGGGGGGGGGERGNSKEKERCMHIFL
ncbi:hypothetical protein Hanom_Chr01g00046381 [Helianthus anomalus]